MLFKFNYLLKFKILNYLVLVFLLISFSTVVFNLVLICKFHNNYQPAAFFSSSYNLDNNRYTDFLYHSPNGFYPFHRPICLVWFFTKQSNILIFFIYLFYVVLRTQHNWCNYIVFIGLIDILLTGMIFHIVIDQGNSFLNIFSHNYLNRSKILLHLEHTINPILYFIFYFFITDCVIVYKKIWIAWVHPTLYVLFFIFYGWYYTSEGVYVPINDISLYTNKTIYKDFQINKDPCEYYPYPFLSPLQVEKRSSPNKKYVIVRFYYVGYEKSSFIIVILFFCVTSFTYILCFLKHHMQQSRYLLKSVLNKN